MQSSAIADAMAFILYGGEFMETYQIQYIGDGRRFVLIMNAKNEKKVLEVMEKALRGEFNSYEITRIKKL